MLNREKAILNHENFDNNDIKIEELPFINKINLRIDNKNNNQNNKFPNWSTKYNNFK